MSLFSFFNKNKNQSKQKSTFDDGGLYARAEDSSHSGKERAKSHRSNTPVDPVLPEKKRARRRLVGAIALALAAIIGLPMILDSEPKPLENDVLIQIPSRDKSFSSPKEQASTPASVSASASLSSSDTTSAAEPQMPASDTLDEQEEVVPPPSPAPAPLLRAPVPVSNIKNQDATSHSPAKSTRNSTQNATKPIQAQVQTQAHVTRTPATAPKRTVEPLSDAAKANAILEGRTNGKSSDVEEFVSQKSTRFVVQVAALADQEKINTLQAKLKSAGIVSHTQKVATQTGERTRIRVGPYTNKEDAEKVRIKLEKLGLNGSILPL